MQCMSHRGIKLTAKLELCVSDLSMLGCMGIVTKSCDKCVVKLLRNLLSALCKLGCQPLLISALTVLLCCVVITSLAWSLMQNNVGQAMSLTAC